MPSANLTKKAPRGKKINQQYLSLYGLKVSERCAKTGAVESFACRVCISFGRKKADNAPRRQRAPPSTVKYFSEPRSAGTVLQHLRLQYNRQWAKFLGAMSAEKQVFFLTEIICSSTK
jgi:hypothetical protein